MKAAADAVVTDGTNAVVAAAAVAAAEAAVAVAEAEAFECALLGLRCAIGCAIEGVEQCWVVVVKHMVCTLFWLYSGVHLGTVCMIVQNHADLDCMGVG